MMFLAWRIQTTSLKSNEILRYYFGMNFTPKQVISFCPNDVYVKLMDATAAEEVDVCPCCLRELATYNVQATLLHTYCTVQFGSEAK